MMCTALGPGKPTAAAKKAAKMTDFLLRADSALLWRSPALGRIQVVVDGYTKCGYALPDTARHVIGCHLTQSRMAQTRWMTWREMCAWL